MWIACRLHDIERQEFVLLELLDGVTSSNDKLPSGPIGDGLRKIQAGTFTQKPVKFQTIAAPKELFEKQLTFNRDWILSFEWAKAIDNGEFYNDNIYLLINN